LNYAEQRYYGSTGGRFLSADPYVASAGASAPQSWNRYVYVEGDPVNWFDPKGLMKECPKGDGCKGGEKPEGGSGNIGGGSGLDNYLPDDGNSELGVTVQSGVPRETKGGWNTDPVGAAKTGWQYLESIWKNCLDGFRSDKDFNVERFSTLLTQEIRWWDLRDLNVAAMTVGDLLGSADSRTLREYTGSLEASVVRNERVYSVNVTLNIDWFSNNTQTQQVASTIHEALHVYLRRDDDQLTEWLSKRGYSPQANSTSGAITDWIGGGCK